MYISPLPPNKQTDKCPKKAKILQAAKWRAALCKAIENYHYHQVDALKGKGIICNGPISLDG